MADSLPLGAETHRKQFEGGGLILSTQEASVYQREGVVEQGVSSLLFHQPRICGIVWPKFRTDSPLHLTSKNIDTSREEFHECSRCFAVQSN